MIMGFPIKFYALGAAFLFSFSSALAKPGEKSQIVECVVSSTSFETVEKDCLSKLIELIRTYPQASHFRVRAAIGGDTFAVFNEAVATQRDFVLFYGRNLLKIDFVSTQWSPDDWGNEKDRKFFEEVTPEILQDFKSKNNHNLDFATFCNSKGARAYTYKKDGRATQ